jgi:hypothetical protein
VNPYYVQPQHIRVLKHFVYTQYGCGIHIQRGAAASGLSHFIATSLSLRPNRALFSLKFTVVHTYYSIRVHPNTHPRHIKVLKHFVYIWYGFELLSTEVWSLNNDITTSYGLSRAQIFEKT